LANFRFNTTDRQNPLGDCPCLDDQPHLGIDSNAIYVSADEFSLRNTAPGFNGSELLVISKDQLLSASSVVKAAFFRNLTLAGIPVVTLMPAISESASDTEYLLNSFPYDQFGNPIPFTNVIGYWSSTRDDAIASGIFPVLTAKTVTIEKYAFPVLAESTPPGNALNPNDDRISQVEFINGQLWSTIETAIHLNGEIVDRDGAAWFELQAGTGHVVEQGYVAARGEYLIYPTILHAFSGLTTVNFTVTSPSLNPSAGFVNLAQPDQIRIAAKGVSPYETVFFRWGDYSAAALDPDGMNIWMANEYVPPRSSQTDVLNWGTRVFEQ
jgi:hypothetical protein